MGLGLELLGARNFEGGWEWCSFACIYGCLIKDTKRPGRFSCPVAGEFYQEGVCEGTREIDGSPKCLTFFVWHI